EVEPNEVACRTCAGPARTAKHSSLLVNGWQSFSFSGTLHGAVKQPRTTMPFFSSPFHAGATFPQGCVAASDRYLLISDMFGLLTLHSRGGCASNGVAAGYLGQENGFGGLAVRSSLPCEALLFSELGASLQGRLATDWGCICGWESTADGCSTPQDKVVQHYLNLVALHNALGPCKPPPAGWCSWYCHGPHVDEALMLSSLEELKSKGLDSGDLQLNLFQLDDGWQSAWGDWLHPHPQRFPNGLKPLVEAIKAAGLTAGLWLAPASLVAASKVAQEHPDWLLKDEGGRPTSCGFTAPGLWMRALDTTHPEVQAHIRQMIHTIVHDWGFKYLKCDFLHCAALPAKRWDSKTSRAAAQATLLRIIREAAGKDVFILGLKFWNIVVTKSNSTSKNAFKKGFYKDFFTTFAGDMCGPMKSGSTVFRESELKALLPALPHAAQHVAFSWGDVPDKAAGSTGLDPGSGPSHPYSRSPKVGNPIASILKSNV
ncbi:galA, partial [Symbiodinium sp. CCMP2456]